MGLNVGNKRNVFCDITLYTLQLILGRRIVHAVSDGYKVYGHGIM